MTLRCEQCGHENDSRYRFCGMCGAKLPLPTRENVPPRTDPAQPTSAARPVSGPSFLGLADEPADPVSYLLEDEPSTGRWGRYLVLAILFAGVAGAAWHWRQDLRSLASRISGGPSTDQSQAAPNQSPAPAGTSSETQAPEVTPSAAGAGNQATPAIESPASAPPTAQPVASAVDQAPNATASTANAAQSKPDQPPPAASDDNSQPANSDSKDEANAKNAEAASPETQAVKPGPAAKSSKNPGDQVPEGSESDALEAQGEKYLYGNGVPANCGLAQKSLLAAAERSNTKAQSVLGTMYATGHCATRDLPLAYHWFARALHQDPSNLRIEQDLKVLWSQMSPDERQLALRAAR